MSTASYEPVYEGGVPVFRPSYDDFKDFRQFVNRIEPIGMKSGIVKVIPPTEWISKLPKTPTAVVDGIEIRNPIVQNINIGSDRGAYGIDNLEKRRKFTVKQWIKQCNNLGNQPPTRRGEKQRILGSFRAVPGEYVHYDDSDFSNDMISSLEAKYWKGIAYGGSPMYGADLPGSLFDDSVTEWNVAHLDSLLSVLPLEVPGVTNAYLYCGMWKATFAWHLEDVDLPSINYIHFGAPKQWYTIPQSHHERFYNLMTALWPAEQNKCSEFLRHKTFLADPEFIMKQGIPVNKIVHRQQEFMITFPYGYHAGFNYGFNIAESVNFAHDSWIDIGANAKKCTCVSHSVGIDVQMIMDYVKNPEGAKVKAAGKSSNSKPKRLGKCVLCPHIYSADYVSNGPGTALAHVTCANLSPRTYVAGQTVYGLDSIENDSFKLKCAYCKIGVGSCFQCSYGQCTRAYHGSCAAAAGVDYSDIHKPVCRYHRGHYDRQHDQKPDPLTLLPGDVVQYLRQKTYGAGVVHENNLKARELILQTLPNPSGVETLDYADIVAVFDEKPGGPFVEPLTFQKLKRKSFGIKNPAPKKSNATEPVSPKLSAGEINVSGSNVSGSDALETNDSKLYSTPSPESIMPLKS